MNENKVEFPKDTAAWGSTDYVLLPANELTALHERVATLTAFVERVSGYEFSEIAISEETAALKREARALLAEIKGQS